MRHSMRNDPRATSGILSEHRPRHNMLPETSARSEDRPQPISPKLFDCLRCGDVEEAVKTIEAPADLAPFSPILAHAMVLGLVEPSLMTVLNEVHHFELATNMVLRLIGDDDVTTSMSPGDAERLIASFPEMGNLWPEHYGVIWMRWFFNSLNCSSDAARNRAVEENLKIAQWITEKEVFEWFLTILTPLMVMRGELEMRPVVALILENFPSEIADRSLFSLAVNLPSRLEQFVRACCFIQRSNKLLLTDPQCRTMAGVLWRLARLSESTARDVRTVLLESEKSFAVVVLRITVDIMHDVVPFVGCLGEPRLRWIWDFLRTSENRSGSGAVLGLQLLEQGLQSVIQEPNHKSRQASPGDAIATMACFAAIWAELASTIQSNLSHKKLELQHFISYAERACGCTNPREAYKLPEMFWVALLLSPVDTDYVVNMIWETLPKCLSVSAERNGPDGIDKALSLVIHSVFTDDEKVLDECIDTMYLTQDAQQVLNRHHPAVESLLARFVDIGDAFRVRCSESGQLEKLYVLALTGSVHSDCAIRTITLLLQRIPKLFSSHSQETRQWMFKCIQAAHASRMHAILYLVDEVVSLCTKNDIAPLPKRKLISVLESRRHKLIGVHLVSTWLRELGSSPSNSKKLSSARTRLTLLTMARAHCDDLPNVWDEFTADAKDRIWNDRFGKSLSHPSELESSVDKWTLRSLAAEMAAAGEAWTCENIIFRGLNLRRRITWQELVLDPTCVFEVDPRVLLNENRVALLLWCLETSRKQSDTLGAASSVQCEDARQYAVLRDCQIAQKLIELLPAADQGSANLINSFVESLPIATSLS